MQQLYVIGIDIGTGSTKAVAIDASGAVLKSAQHYYLSSAVSANTEQDVYAVSQAFQQCIKEIVAALQQAPAAISLSSAMHSILAVDKEGKPLMPALLWSDTRSSAIAEALRNSPLGERIYNATGTPLHSMSPLCKIKWLQQNEPDVFSKAFKFISIKEFIWHQLFDEYVIDHSLASATGLFNIYKLQWEEAALSFAGIDKQKLSAPVPVTYKKANVNPSMAAAMAIGVDTTFLIGSSDGCLANLGSLCLRSSEAAITIGTSAAVRITSQKPVQNFERMIFNYLLDERTFICGGAINNGGNVFQWLLEGLLANHPAVKNYEQLFSLVASVPPCSKGLLFLPYIHGERSPIWDEQSSGLFLGIKAIHGPEFFARATAEGVCFALQHILFLLEEICGPVEQIAVSGGLVHSNVIMQMLANVTGKKVVVQQTEDASAIGAAYLAQKALGVLEDFFVLPKREAAAFFPEKEIVEQYQKQFAVYKEIYPLVKDKMHLLYQLST